MKAIGAARGQIIRHYLTLVTVYGAIGTCIGLLVGIPGGYLLAQFLGGLVVSLSPQGKKQEAGRRLPSFFCFSAQLPKVGMGQSQG